MKTPVLSRSSPCLLHLNIRQESSCLPTRKKPLIRCGIHQNLILDFPGSRTLMNKGLLFKPCRLWHFAVWHHKLTKILPKSDKSKTKLIISLHEMPASLSPVFSSEVNDVTFYPVVQKQEIWVTSLTLQSPSQHLSK